MYHRKATAAANAAREAARDEQNHAELQEGAPSLFAFMNTCLSDSAYPEDNRSAPLQSWKGSAGQYSLLLECCTPLGCCLRPLQSLADLANVSAPR